MHYRVALPIDGKECNSDACIARSKAQTLVPFFSSSLCSLPDSPFSEGLLLLLSGLPTCT